MDFQTAHAAFIGAHLEQRSGERKGRLERGHGHGEKLFLQQVWWLVKGDFEHLHPEYELQDWMGRSFFADFAWLPPGWIRLLIEIKGFSSHVRDMDRHKFCRELNRETFLHAMGFTVISFAYDDIEQRPELCIRLLRMVINRYQPAQVPVERAVLAEKELIRLAAWQSAPLRPKEVERHFAIDHKTAVLMLSKLCSKGWMTPVYGANGQRATGYKLVREAVDYLD
ncbi:MAG: hypothetical protein J7639_13160 [Paenibacillaceae bacterium]|nr:hypothetical protein [Paenibacillaceae bacterium]